MGTGTKIALGVIGAIVLIVLIFGGTIASTYNSLVTLDQSAQAQWGQVENVYQRRADLVPNLVATVKGAANFEQSTLTAVTEARAKVGQDRVGEVAIEYFRGPRLPIREHLRQVVQDAGEGVCLEQDDARWGCTGASFEDYDR